MRCPVLVLLASVACTPRMDDNSLEAVELAVETETEGPVEVTGVLTATAGDEEGDWTLSIGETTLTYHSPSHADLSTLSGETLTVATQPYYSLADGMILSDDTGPRFAEASMANEDGSTAFGHPVWEMGEVIGEGVVTQLVDGVEEEEQEVQFIDVVVATDDGERRLLPGEPTTLAIPAETWRFVVLAAYLAVNRADSKCGAPDLVAIEALRTEEAPGPSLKRPAARYGPVGGCG